MSKRSQGGSRGQILIVFVLALVAMIAMTGLIIDGGNAYANQRGTQNATDSAAEAGATVLMSGLLGATRNDSDVLAAMNLAAADNNIKAFGPDDADHSVAFYTDVRGNMLTALGVVTAVTTLAAQVGGGLIPPCLVPANCVDPDGNGIGVATGVRALGRRTFNNYVSSAVGLGQFGAQSDATAVAGYVFPCDATEGCAILPVTFAISQTVCDGSGDESYSDIRWIPDPATWSPPAGSPPTNEALLTLCKKGEGAFGWLDFGGGNTASQIITPTNQQFFPPLWQLGQPGNPNNVEDELATYFGDQPGVYEGPDDPDGDYDQTVLIPFFDALCNEDRPDYPNYEPPADPDPDGVFPGECENNPSGGGANRYYSIPYFIGFILDRAYVQGNNFPECENPPNNAGPVPGGNGSGGCIIGWFARVAATGPVGAVAPGGLTASPVGVQLIR